MTTVRELAEKLVKEIDVSESVLETLIGPPDPSEEKEGRMAAATRSSVFEVSDLLTHALSVMGQVSELLDRLRGQFDNIPVCTSDEDTRFRQGKNG